MKKLIKKYVTIPNVIIALLILGMILIATGKIRPMGGMTGSSSTGSVTAYVTQGTADIFRSGGTVINGGPLHLDRILVQTDVAGEGLILYNASNSTSSIFEFYKLQSDTIGGNMEGVYEFDIDLDGLNAVVSPNTRVLFIYDPK